MEQSNKRLVLGLIFIVFGVIFLLDNLNVLEFTIPRYLWRWEMILIIIGAINIFSKNYSAAFTLIGIGAFFWAIDDYNINFWDLWPVVLIIIGISFILKQGLLSPEKKKLMDDQKTSSTK